jgi:hypothetical protein
MSFYWGLCVVLVSLNMLVSSGIILFFYYRKLTQLEGYLEGIHSVEWNRTVCRDGLLGRQIRFSNIITIVLMPTLHFKRGEIPKDADKRIPVRLRRQMKAAAAYVAVTGLAMVALYFFGPDRSVS